MGTPVPQDLLTRYVAGMFDERQIIGVPTAGQTFFGRPETGAETIYSPDKNTVDIDIIRGNERHAALVPRGMISRDLQQTNLRAEQFSSFSRSFPLVVEQGNVTGENLTVRVAGEAAVGSNLSQRDRLLHHAVKIFTESVRRTVRLYEILSWESLMTGKMSAILGTSNAALKYDFLRDSNLTVTVGTDWASGTADIMGDIDTMCGKGRSIGHVTFDMMVLGSDAMSAFIKDTTVKALADNRRFDFMSMGRGAVMPAKFQKFIDGGFTFQGNLRTPQGYDLALFTYNEGYTNTSDTYTKYIAADKILFAYSGARCDRYFGPPETLPMVPMRAMMYREMLGMDPNSFAVPSNVKNSSVVPVNAFFSDCYCSTDWTRITFRTQSAPIFATTQTDAFGVLDIKQ